jgi:sulfide dehydrogenase cytochrome subunit
MRFSRKTLLLAGITLCAAHSGFAADEKKDEPKPEVMSGASAEMLANTCFGCHGPDGASSGPATPTIAGISTEYFEELMNGYASGEVPSTIMGRIAKGYSEEEISSMAKVFSNLPFVSAPDQTFDKKLAKKGAKLHDKYCEKCHADGGTSAEDDAGILAGQWTTYTKASLKDYQDGAREPTKKMKKKMKKLMEKEGDAGFEALLNYYASKK